MNWVEIVIGESSDKPEECTLEVKCTREAADSLVRLLKHLAYLGNIGASRNITVDGVEKGDERFGFDGDGAAHIASLKRDGKEQLEHK